MSIRELNVHVTKISATALGRSLKTVPFGVIREASIIERCVIAKIGRTRVERKLAREFGNDVGV